MLQEKNLHRTLACQSGGAQFLGRVVSASAPPVSCIVGAGGSCLGIAVALHWFVHAAILAVIAAIQLQCRVRRHGPWYGQGASRLEVLIKGQPLALATHRHLQPPSSGQPGCAACTAAPFCRPRLHRHACKSRTPPAVPLHEGAGGSASCSPSWHLPCSCRPPGAG